MRSRQIQHDQARTAGQRGDVFHVVPVQIKIGKLRQPAQGGHVLDGVALELQSGEVDEVLKRANMIDLRTFRIGVGIFVAQEQFRDALCHFAGDLPFGGVHRLPYFSLQDLVSELNIILLWLKGSRLLRLLYILQ